MNNIVRLSEILEIAGRSKRDYGIEGATLIGGEPTLQPSLGALAHGLRSLGLGVILFTGRDFEELEEGLVGELDLVIDGKYQSDNKDTERNLMGSRNQRIIEVTDRYHDSLRWFLDSRPDYVEIDVKDGFLISNGSNFRFRSFQWQIPPNRILVSPPTTELLLFSESGFPIPLGTLGEFRLEYGSW